MKTVLERFEARFITEPNTGCWLWIGAIWGNNDYGCFYDGEKNQQAHVAAAFLYLGERPLGRKRLHSCDVPLCVNPNHGRWGTQKENMADAFAKGRRANSLANITAPKLTRAIVEEIRASHESQPLLAKRFGVSQPTISMVKAGLRGNCLPN